MRSLWPKTFAMNGMQLQYPRLNDDGLIRFWRKKTGSCFPSLEVAFDPWIIYQVFSQNSISIVDSICYHFFQTSPFHSWNVASPQVWRCAKATHPLLARQLRERLEEHCSKEVVLPGDDPNQSYLYLGFFKQAWPWFFWISRGFQQQIWKKGLQCMVERCLLISYDLLCLFIVITWRQRPLAEYRLAR